MASWAPSLDAMESISTNALRAIVEDRERAGEQAISVTGQPGDAEELRRLVFGASD